MNFDRSFPELFFKTLQPALFSASVILNHTIGVVIVTFILLMSKWVIFVTI